MVTVNMLNHKEKVKNKQKPNINKPDTAKQPIKIKKELQSTKVKFREKIANLYQAVL